MHDTKLGNIFSFKDFILLVLAGCLFTIAGFIHQKNAKPIIVISKQDSAINLNQNIFRFLNLGNKRLIADLLWIQTLLESDEEHYQKRDLNSWMYLRFLNISMLDPLFYENYLFGGQLLSIVKDDLEGAENIYKRGLKYYPDNFELNYHSGFNLYFEMENLKEGLVRLKKVQKHPKAPWTLNLLINKLEFETGRNFDTALEFLKIHYSMTKDEQLKEKLQKDIYSLKAEKDLKCLNTKSDNCDKFDANGDQYKYTEGQWTSKVPYIKYRIHRLKKE